MILNFTFGVLFLKILFRTRLFWICPHFPVDIIRVFLNFRFSSRKSQSPQKLAKKITYFTTQFHPKNLTLFDEPQLTLHWKQYAPATLPKTFLGLEIFLQTYFCLVSEKTFALHDFLTPKNRILEALWKQMSVYLSISP